MRLWEECFQKWPKSSIFEPSKTGFAVAHAAHSKSWSRRTKFRVQMSASRKNRISYEISGLEQLPWPPVGLS